MFTDTEALVDFKQLVLVLSRYVKNYGEKNFSYFYNALNDGEKFCEEEVIGTEGQSCYIQCWTQQHYENGQENWLDVVVTVSWKGMEIGSNIVFHENGYVEKSEVVRLFRFSGLPITIANLR